MHERDGMTSLRPRTTAPEDRYDAHVVYVAVRASRAQRSTGNPRAAGDAASSKSSARGRPRRSSEEHLGEGTLGAVVEGLPSLQSSKGALESPLVCRRRSGRFSWRSCRMMPRINRERARICHQRSVTAAAALALVADEEPPAAEGARGQ